jgi:hypothetical protein
MHKLRPSMKQCRVDVINQAFEKLDVNKDQAIMLADLEGKVCREQWIFICIFVSFSFISVFLFYSFFLLNKF